MANEKRLIDANELLRNVDRYFFWSADEVRRFIATADTVDAVEVVHGQWFVIEDDYFDLVELKCSVCGESWGFEEYEDCIPQNYHYCPNCGADMRERKDND